MADVENMPDTSAITSAIEVEMQELSPNWVANANVLWQHRRLLARVAGVALVISTIIAFTWPKQYESVARLMPPEQSGSGGALLAALAGRSLGGLGGLGGLAGSLLGEHTSGALYQEILKSRTVRDRLIDRFQLQQIYRKRYRIDTEKYLAKHTTLADDKKSGVITLTFKDTDPQRAQVIAQAYLDELNTVLTRSNISSARREREFIEKRLVSVQDELQSAQKALSDFSSTNTTLDIKEQTHAMVDADAKLQAELIVGRSELDSLEQIYGNDNIRVRSAKARIASLQGELDKMGGSSADTVSNDGKSNGDKEPYPSLRQIPRLAVPYANLYRRVRIEETVFELLSQQYELARMEEAKDTPVVNVLDRPLVPEKKSFPPRLILLLALTIFAVAVASVFLLLRNRWRQVDYADPRKALAHEIVHEIATSIRAQMRRMPRRMKGAR